MSASRSDGEEMAARADEVIGRSLLPAKHAACCATQPRGPQKRGQEVFQGYGLRGSFGGRRTAMGARNEHDADGTKVAAATSQHHKSAFNQLFPLLKCR